MLYQHSTQYLILCMGINGTLLAFGTKISSRKKKEQTKINCYNIILRVVKKTEFIFYATVLKNNKKREGKKNKDH